MSKNGLHLQGQIAEERVERVFREKGYEIIGRRLRTPFAEVDLFISSPAGQKSVVEVKKVSYQFSSEPCVSQRQLQRLERACLYLSGKVLSEVSLIIAAVSHENEVIFFDEIFMTN